MIQEPFIFALVLVLSLGISHAIFRRRGSLVYKISRIPFFIGVFFHEASHAIMCLISGMPIEHIKVRWRDEWFRTPNPHGSVTPKRQATFIQAFIIAFAPLYFSTWLIFLLWFGIFFNSAVEPIFRGLALVIIISLFLTAAPSTTDMQCIAVAFRENSSHSLYQILLISISIFILWIILVITQIAFFLDVLYYVAIAGIYLTIKFSLIGSKKLITYISTRNYMKPRKIKMKSLTHKRYKPQKPPKRL